MSTQNDRTQQFTLPSGATVEFTPWSVQEARQSETIRQLQEAGIELSFEQKVQLEQAISEAIANTLTLEQQQLWQQYESNQSTQAGGNEISVQRNQAIEAALKQVLSDAGVPLTPQQEAQIEQMNEQMGNELGQVLRSNPLQAFGQLLASFFFPQPLATRLFGRSAIGRSVVTYIATIDRILTPEQQQIWNLYWSDRNDTR